ncbi:MAG: hypothetical protein ACRC14_02695 [Paracoccaceae bacterium]
MAFIFGGNTPWTYEDLQRKRAVAESLLAGANSSPRNVGEGLNAIGKALAYRGIEKRASKEEARMRGEFNAKWGSVFGGGGTSASPGYAAPQSTTPTSPLPDPSNALASDAMAALGQPERDNAGRPIMPHDHASHAGQTHADWMKYSNQGATRNDPLDPKLVDAMSFVGDMGITMDVISGGQEAAGEGGSRTGSTRHDHGNSADVDFYKDGRKLDWNNPDDLPVLQEIVRTAKSRGVTGIGAGDDYMGAGRFHVGFGAPTVWGAGGKSANAPAWLVEAYNGAPTGTAPQGGGALQGTAPAGGGMDIGTLVGLASDPMASPQQKAVIEALIGQQMQMMDPAYQMEREKAALELEALKNPQPDPMKAIELEKAEIELARLKNPEAEIPKTLQERTALADAAGLEEGDVRSNYLLTGELPKPAGGSEFGLTPVLGRDKDGNVVVLQLGKDGVAVQTQMPEGVTADIGLLEEEKSKGAAIGKAEGEDTALLDSTSSKMEGLEQVVSQLETLADKATYTYAGQVRDTVKKQLGLEPGEAAIARSEYIAMVDNQVLPMLRDTFGAAFTVREGETLRATLGDPDKSPQEKKAVLRAFIEQKKRDIKALETRTGQPGSDAPAASDAPLAITSDAEYDALPSGTVFVDPEGKTRRKP